MPGSVRLCNVVVFLSFGCVLTSSGLARAEGSNASSTGAKEVVVDNRGAASQPARDYEMDSPFAESKPDPVQKREDGWRHRRFDRIVDVRHEDSCREFRATRQTHQAARGVARP